MAKISKKPQAPIFDKVEERKNDSIYYCRINCRFQKVNSGRKETMVLRLCDEIFAIPSARCAGNRHIRRFTTYSSLLRPIFSARSHSARCGVFPQTLLEVIGPFLCKAGFPAANIGCLFIAQFHIVSWAELQSNLARNSPKTNEFWIRNV